MQQVTKKGQLEKKPSNPLHRSVWKQYTFILNKHTLRYVNDHNNEVSTLFKIIFYKHLMISLLKIKELRCADIVQIDSDTDAKDAQFPVTINFKGSSRRTLYLRAQSKVSQTEHV